MRLHLSLRHPDSVHVRAYSKAQLEPTEVRWVEEHLRLCPRCGDTYFWAALALHYRDEAAKKEAAAAAAASTTLSSLASVLEMSFNVSAYAT